MVCLTSLLASGNSHDTGFLRIDLRHRKQYPRRQGEANIKVNQLCRFGDCKWLNICETWKRVSASWSSASSVGTRCRYAISARFLTSSAQDILNLNTFHAQNLLPSNQMLDVLSLCMTDLGVRECSDNLQTASGTKTMAMSRILMCVMRSNLGRPNPFRA